jgi:murein hydrolase activator
MRSRHRPRKREAALTAALILILAAAPAAAGGGKVPVPHPRPALPADRKAPDPDSGIDLSRAVPLKSLLHQPSTAEQFRSLSSQVAKDKPRVDSARTESETLAQQAEALRQKLVRTAARVEQLESAKSALDLEVARLSAQNDSLSASFAHDRISVSRLLAVLQRLQHDMPPAMAVRPDDALSAARGAMLIGASLPGVYGEAADLARRIEALRRTRAALVARRAEAARNTDYLAQARIELDQLLAMKRLEADAAAGRYGDLKKKFDMIASRAVNLQALLQKVAQLRSVPLSQGVVTVTADRTGRGKLGRGSLLRPVVGTPAAGGLDGVGGSAAPGLTYAAAPGAQVISPVDGQVLFAAPYQRSGQVLILEMADGYDAVLVGLDRLEVRTGNRVLAGEPVGTMSKSNREPRLYFELRQNGRGMSPAPYIAAALKKANKP